MNIVKLSLTVMLLSVMAITGYAQTDPAKAIECITKEIKLPTRKEVGKKELFGTYTFIVETDGSISNIAIVDSTGFGVDEQVVKQLSDTKNWKVQEIAGEPTRISYKLPLRIKLPKR